MELLVRYHQESKPIEKISVGDWIDLRSAEDVDLDPLEYRKISLGISMKLPEGYEAHLRARSSTYEKWGILLTTGESVIDNSYCGDSDIWKAPVLAMRRTHIHAGDRIVQFRIVPKQPDYTIRTVAILPDKSRGGFGSTGHT